MCDFAFCIEITQYTNEVKVNLLGVNHLIYEIFDRITAFERKSGLWELYLLSYNDALSNSDKGKAHRC